MKCPVCNIEARITRNTTIVKMVEGQPKVFSRMEYKCMNPQCSKYNKVIKREDVEIPTSIINDEEPESEEE